MSLFNYYRSYRYLNGLPTVSYSNEDIEEISMEGSMDIIKKIIQKIKHFIKVIAKNIWNGLTKILDFLFKRKDKDQRKLELLTAKDKRELYKNALIKFAGFKNASLESTEKDYKAIIKSELLGENGRTIYFINKDGSINDLDLEFKLVDDYYKAIIEDYPGDEDAQERAYGLLLRSETGLIVNNIDALNKVDIDGLIKLISYDKLGKYRHEIKENIPKELKRIDAEIAKLERDKTPENEDVSKREIAALKTLYKTMVFKFQIYQSILGFYYIVSYRLYNGFDFVEPVKDNEKLYHLSFDPDLGVESNDILTPQIPTSTRFKDKNFDSIQILPERISFSSEVKYCSVGIYFRARKYLLLNIDNLDEEYFIAALYQGIPNTIEEEPTTKLKEWYVREYVDEWDASKEICITSRIKVKKIGYVKVYLDKERMHKVKTTQSVIREWGKLYLRHEMVSQNEFDDYRKVIDEMVKNNK